MKISTVNEVIFSTRSEAEEIRDVLNKVIEIYGWVTVADFYDLVGVNHSYTDNKYGWKNAFDDEAIIRDKDGWVIRFPDTCEFK